jgi:dephospho-CoA kinase
MTKIIGLTGGIGSGKTTVASLFRDFGIPVYIADEEAKKLMNSQEIINEVTRVFGNEVLHGHQIGREKLAAIVFSNPEKLQQLNAIIHPAVKSHFMEWVKKHHGRHIVIKEAAILFESGNDKDCDAVITVTAPLETRIERVLQRDKTTRDEVLKRIENQWPDELRLSKSDYVIENVNIKETARQVSDILKKLQNL